MTLLPGTRLGAYEILAPIGAGGMGEVYRARDKKLDRDVAIKVLPESVASDPATLARFEREAKAVAALSHPNILSIFDFGTHDGITYAVTELLEGETLRGKYSAGPIAQKQAVDYALQIARGLAAAHEKGLVHRDLKPENVFVTRDGRLKILDFGLAKRVESVAPGEETAAPTVSGHTEPGTVMGTLTYMSPEQVKGLPVDHRSDIFSFGTILYEMLSGRRPFTRPTASETIAAILKEEPPQLTESGRDISPALDSIVRHCMEKDRDNRFQTAKDVAFNLSEQSSPSRLGQRSTRCACDRQEEGADRRCGRRHSRGRGRLPCAAFAPGRRRDREREACRRAALREPGGARGRLLRRWHRRRDSRQVDGVARFSGDRARQLDALQENDEDSEADRQGARGRLPPDRHRALGEERRHQPRPRQPRAHRRVGLRRAHVEVAAAVRRSPHGRLPGAIGHRDPRGAGAGRCARGGRGEAAFRKAHAERRGLRRLPAGRRHLESDGDRGSGQLAQGSRCLRAGRGARPPIRSGLGKGRTCQITPVQQQRSDARAGGASQEGRRDGDRAGPGPARGIPRARRLPVPRHQRPRPRAGAVHEGTRPCAGQCGSPAGDGLRGVEPRPMGGGNRTPSASRAPRSPVGLDQGQARHCPGRSEALPGGARGPRERSRVRARQPESDRTQGHDVSWRGRPGRCQGCPQGRAQRGRAHDARGLPGELRGPGLAPG